MAKPQNVIVWFDLPTLDFERACAFYEKVLADEIRVDEQTGMRYGFFPMEGRMGVGGGLIPPQDSTMLKPAPNGMGPRIYFNVDGRLDEAIDAAEMAGGRVIRPKYHMEMAGWLAVIEDTEGNQVGLWSAEPKQ
jgi:predicted enzyme related to lactoylglutathione lyase